MKLIYVALPFYFHLQITIHHAETVCNLHKSNSAHLIHLESNTTRIILFVSLIKIRNAASRRVASPPLS